MPEISVSKAKTWLPRLLRRVQAGERFTITKHGHPIAELVPFQPQDSARVQSAIEALKKFQQTHRLDGLSVLAIVEAARKY